MMKKWIGLSVVGLVLSGCSTISSYDDPASYHQEIQYILTQADTVYQTYSTYAQQTTLQNLPQLKIKRESTIDDITKLHDQLLKVGPYKAADQSNNEYYNNAITYITHTLSLLRTQESQLIGLRTEIANYPDSEWTPAIENEYKARQLTIINTINTIIEEDNHMMMQTQELFAKQNGLTLSGGTLLH